jgi:hypothetical protein
LFCVVLSACGDDETVPPPASGTTVVFDLAADVSTVEHFFDLPYPNDLRLDADGHPDVRAYQNPALAAPIVGLATNAAQAKSFPVIPVAYFKFSAPLAARSLTDVVPASPSSPFAILDVDPSSPHAGEMVPVVVSTLEADAYTAENVVAIAPRPGFILRPGTKYAAIVLKGALDAEGNPLGENPALARVIAGKSESDAERTASVIYAPLASGLAKAGIPSTEVAAATVFTTGKVVQESAAMGDAIVASRDVTIDGLSLDADETYPELCVLRGTVTLPQFQAGTPPFNTEGRFVFDASGVPIEQRTEVAPVAITIPRTEMPAAGYPLILNVHGSGGYSIAMVRPVGDDGMPGDPIGPSFPIATKGIAMGGFAMPLNPERFPGAEETEYLNIENFAAMRDTFRQGLLEARLVLEALEKLTIPAATLAACTGATLPNGETSFKFDPSKLAITGQSMGGMYTNMIAATEPKLRAAVPTGAGGHWTYFILQTKLRDGQIPSFLVLILGTSTVPTFVHPALSIGAAGLEPADPIIYMPHVARRPLAGHPVRPIYEPVGRDDSYFPTSVYDAVAIAYGHRQAGDVQWPEMQEALGLAGLAGIESFPVSDNVVSETGTNYTGSVVQYLADGPYDPHAIYSHRDDVKRQYSCFWDSFMKTGRAVVVPPTTDWAAPCP